MVFSSLPTQSPELDAMCGIDIALVLGGTFVFCHYMTR